MAMMQPGMFLSQPGMAMQASYHWPPITVSIESAIKSRDCSEYDMPSVPIEMPSLTPIVLNRRPTSPAAATPCFNLFGEHVEVHVARVALVPDAGDADLGLVHVGLGQAGAVEHGLRGALGLGLRDVRAELVERGTFERGHSYSIRWEGWATRVTRGSTLGL